MNSVQQQVYKSLFFIILFYCVESKKSWWYKKSIPTLALAPPMWDQRSNKAESAANQITSRVQTLMAHVSHKSILSFKINMKREKIE